MTRTHLGGIAGRTRRNGRARVRVPATAAVPRPLAPINIGSCTLAAAAMVEVVVEEAVAAAAAAAAAPSVCGLKTPRPRNCGSWHGGGVCAACT